MTPAYQQAAGNAGALSDCSLTSAHSPACLVQHSYLMAKKALKSHNVELISGENISTGQVTVMLALRKPGHSTPDLV